MFVGSIVPVSPLIYDAKDTATVDPETSAMPISPARCDAILFDVDGVILDSKANMAAAWAAVRAQTGTSISFEAYFSEIGRPFADIMARLGLASKAPEIERVFRTTSAAVMAETPIYAGIGEVLKTLAAANIKLGIVTSKDATRTGLVLDRLPVEFQCVTSPRPDLRGKPAPDCLLYTIAKLNIDPAHCFYIGDMDSDELAAARAHVPYAHVSWGYGDSRDPDIPILQTPEDILSLTGLVKP
ncbi:HAD family hydrolase [Oricola sp.]|uniref:HAD family hydrolase n=1 Tax=Oricola sp. TaxID=1979950 RepID=UPI000C8E65F9|nr:hydrolase [Ahrensia sp.]|tara:strand:+ start:6830 stop:7555 length:726 start_codon:yes stop_codon:yes gene_type:complete